MRIRSAATSLAALLALAACHAEPKTPAHQLGAVTRGAIAEAVSATGEVAAMVTVSVGSQISGTIHRLHVDFNSPVKKGQVLAELDTRLFDAALARAVAGLAAARADVERARVSLLDAARTEKRFTELLKKGLVAAAEADAAATARAAASAGVLAAEARVLQAQADRDTAATNLALCLIRSPIDGIVISRAIDVGQTVAASLQSPVLFLIANDLGRMQVLANVDEADVGKIKAGLQARFTVDAYPGETFQGRIREVRQAPTTIQNVVTYAAVIEAANPDRKLRQGMTASVTVVTSQRQDALLIPNAALRYRPAEASAEEPAGKGRAGLVAVARADGGERPRRAEAGEGAKPGQRKARAWRLEGGRPAKVSLVVGISDGHFTEVLSGLSEGEQVVLADADKGGGKRGLF
jgi:HlyD family secretion protein